MMESDGMTSNSLQSESSPPLDRPARVRTGQISAVVVFALALIAPVLGQLAGWGTGGNSEALAKKPVFQTSNLPAFIDQSERWIDDNFGFRRPLIQLNAAVLSLVGASASRDVLIGRDGWLFYRGNDSIEQHRGLENYSESELTAYVTALEARRRWLEKLGTRMVVLVAPDKSTIYPEYLVPQMPQVAPTRLDQLVAATAGTDLLFLDLRPTLKAAKSTGPLYYKTDTHWTPLGAYVAANQLLHAFHPAFPRLDTLQVGAWTFDRAFSAGGDLMHMLDDPWDAHEVVPVPVRNFPDQVRAHRSEVVPMPLGNLVWASDLDGSITLTARVDRPKLLVIGDSFSVALLPFLQQEFSQVAFIAYRDTSFGEYRFVEQYRPDIVLFETVERFLEAIPSNPSEIAHDY
jgi:hypothetical protein